MEYIWNLENQRSLKQKSSKFKKLCERQAMDRARIGLTEHPEVDFNPVSIKDIENLGKLSKYD